MIDTKRETLGKEALEKEALEKETLEKEGSGAVMTEHSDGKYGAVVTGASSGIGCAIAAMLLTLGYEVYGIGRDFQKNDVETGDVENHNAGAAEKAPVRTLLSHPDFHAVTLDLLQEDEALSRLREIRRNCDLRLLVNNAGVAYYGLHEEVNAEKIRRITRTNLEIPMLFTGEVLRSFKEKSKADPEHPCGLIYISSVTALGPAPHGAAYGATKAALRSFGSSVFQEARKYGVRVTTILPDLTESGLYRNADFTTDPAMDAHLTPEDVAEAVRFAVTARPGMVVPELLLQPRLSRICRK